MKRVLVLNADSFVGIHVCRRFFEAKEYLIDGTLYHQPLRPLVESTQETMSVDTFSASADADDNFASTTGTTPQEQAVPPHMQLLLHSVMPRHGEISDEVFRVRLLMYDIIIAVLEEDAFEAECAIRVLRGSHYEVEKTFVLVTNVLTWAQTDMHERELQRAERRAKREASRALRDEESEASSVEGVEEEEEEMEIKVWSEEEYHRRCEDFRYHVWKTLEHNVKHANSETLHTYVLWAGLPYGEGEDLLAPYFRAAWRHQKLLQYGDGSNYVPTIHVRDLSRIIYLVGSSYDTLEDRYMFAVDQGNNTQAEILQGIRDFIGGEVEITETAIDRENQFEIKRMNRLHEALEVRLERDIMFSGKHDQDSALVGTSQQEMEPECVKTAERRKGSEDADDRHKEKMETGTSAAENGMVRMTTATVCKGLKVDPPHGVANWFSAVNVRCEPGVVLSLLDESEWVALGGFFSNIDKVAREFKAERLLQPLRIVLSGPPLSMTEEVASRLSKLLDIPHLTVAKVIAAYELHTADVRAELVETLMRRRARRRDAREERLRREKERAEMARAEVRRKRREEDDGDEEEENEESGELMDKADEEEETEEEEGGEEDEEESDGKERGGGTVERTAEYYTDAILLRTAGGGEEEEEEEEEEEDEEEDVKVAALRRHADEADRRRIATLREEYRFATQLLSLRLVNGEFPPGPKSKGDSDGEEEEEEDDGNEESDEEAGDRRRRQREKEKAALLAEKEEEGSEAVPAPVIRYMDETLAVMVRWRLRQEDCRSQGYILECFPWSVRQARLTFLADTEEQKEMQRLKLQRDSGEDEGPKLPLDANFPLPALHSLDKQQQAEMLDAMMGKTFPSAEEALAPTHDAFFPDCFIVLTSSDVTLQAHMNAAHAGDKDGEAVCRFYEQLSQYVTHNRPSAPPTESLLTWFQTVTAEGLEEGVDGKAVGDVEEGNSTQRVPRTLSVLRMLAFPSFIKTTQGNSQLNGTCSDIDAYCKDIQLRIFDTIGHITCGEVIDAIRAERDKFISDVQELENEEAVLQKLGDAEVVYTEAERDNDEAAIKEERHVLRYYQAREMLGEMVDIRDMPTDVYLMRYVLPSLVPLMAEVVRQRPDDPVRTLADALFHHKRQIVL